MKKLGFIALAAALALPMASYAECDSSLAHCSHFNGTPGKYVKLLVYINDSYLGSTKGCAFDGAQLIVRQSDVDGQFLKEGDKVSLTYQQCADGKCSTANALDEESFVIKKEGNDYTSDPREHNVNAFDSSYGKNCHTKFDTNALRGFEVR